MIFNIPPGKFLSDKNNTNLGFNEVTNEEIMSWAIEWIQKKLKPFKMRAVVFLVDRGNNLQLSELSQNNQQTKQKSLTKPKSYAKINHVVLDSRCLLPLQKPDFCLLQNLQRSLSMPFSNMYLKRSCVSILGGQRMLLGVLFHHPPPYSLKTGCPLNPQLSGYPPVSKFVF